MGRATTAAGGWVENGVQLLVYNIPAADPLRYCMNAAALWFVKLGC